KLATRKSAAGAAKAREKAKPPARKTKGAASTARASSQPAKRPALILNRRGNSAPIKLDVMARDFTPRIAERLSDYDEGVSPQVSWSGAPKEAQSYVVMLEDPDAPKEQPFVHWVAYGIPGHIHELPEGLERNAEMGQPVAILQGVNSKGETGYYGPRPPEGP